MMLHLLLFINGYFYQEILHKILIISRPDSNTYDDYMLHEIFDSKESEYLLQ
jgi:hypothetical protein